MTKKKKNKPWQKLLIVFVLVVSLFTTTLGSLMPLAKADTVAGSSVLADLQKDENFKLDNYPAKADDYSLQVIQIAESSAKELLVYVYQPAAETKKLQATSINISTGINDNVAYKNYKLTYLSSEKTLAKYAVQEFELKSDALRYYDISSIFRKWEKGLDEEPTDDNTIDEVSFEVAQLWTASTVNGQVSYSCVETETVEIVNKHVGSIYCENGWFSRVDAIDSHYIAFSTNKQIDKLIDADISFTYTPMYKRHNLGGDHIYTNGETQLKQLTLSETDKVTLKPSGIGGKKYEWNRIQSVETFKNENELKDETLEALLGTQWVFRFFETDYRVSNDGNLHYYYTVVNEVTILRLKFDSDGKIYNLGVVDNKQSGDTRPDNKVKSWWDKLAKWAKILVGIGLGLLACIALAIVIWIIKLIVGIVALPFKAIK